MDRYLLITMMDVEPMILGPYFSGDERSQAALKYKKEHGDRDGIFMLSIDDYNKPSVDSFTNRFFEEGLQEDDDDV